MNEQANAFMMVTKPNIHIQKKLSFKSLLFFFLSEYSLNFYYTSKQTDVYYCVPPPCIIVLIYFKTTRTVPSVVDRSHVNCCVLSFFQMTHIWHALLIYFTYCLFFYYSSFQVWKTTHENTTWYTRCKNAGQSFGSLQGYVLFRSHVRCGRRLYIVSFFKFPTILQN